MLRFKLLLILAIILSSCSTKKNIVKQEEKIEVVTKIDENLSQVSKNSETLIDTSSTEEICYEPIDSNKSFVVNGKEYKNVRIKTSKYKNGISISKKDEVVLNQTKTTSNKVITKSNRVEKEIDRSVIPWLFWVIVIIVVLWLFRKELIQSITKIIS